MVGDPRHTIRVRADPSFLAGMTSPGERGGTHRVCVAVRRHGLTIGAAVAVEVSFGPLSDEVVLHGEIEHVDADGDGTYTIAISETHAMHFAYVQAVLTNQRQPIVRRHRRVERDVPVAWTYDGRTRRSRSGDISCGGVFIVDPRPPAVGSKIDVRLELGIQSLTLCAEVTWAGQARGSHGFGVRFANLARDGFEQIRRLVDDTEVRAP